MYTDFATARTNMIKQQLRTCEVHDDRILNVIDATPRELFVPKAYQSLAYADARIPLDEGQMMLLPTEEARILQAIQAASSDTVLEIGTGTGYFTALLAKIVQRVTTVDILPHFTQAAEQSCKILDLTNIDYISSNALQENTHLSDTYNIIIISGALVHIPLFLQEKVAIGGRLFAILGKSPAMHAVLLTRQTKDTWQKTFLFETDVPYLIHAAKPETFKF
jgi:protein-L-isoaspartate(D-aspartate) O-methyltransferase